MAALFLDVDINFTGMALRYCCLRRVFWSSPSTYGPSAFVSRHRHDDSRLTCHVGRGFDASLVRLLSRHPGRCDERWRAAFGLQNLGVDIVPLLAGIGVGGLAVALAIRPTLENLIGGLILFSDKPVRVGDFCTFGA